jgi:hypothetical protein
MAEKLPLPEAFGMAGIAALLFGAALAIVHLQQHSGEYVDQIPATHPQELVQQVCAPHTPIKPKAVTVTRDRQGRHLTPG